MPETLLTGLGVTLLCCSLAAFLLSTGFRDTAAILAAPLRTRALTVQNGVLLIAGFSIIGTLLGSWIAPSITQEFVSILRHPSGIFVLALGTISALIWSWRQSQLGLPTSSGQALIAGILGAYAASLLQGAPTKGASSQLLLWLGATILTPLVAIGAGYLLMFPLLWLNRSSQSDTANQRFRQIQTVATSILAIGHAAQHGLRATLLISLGLPAVNLEFTPTILWTTALLAAVLLSTGALLTLRPWALSQKIPWKTTHTITGIISLDPGRAAVAQLLSAILVLSGLIGTQFPVSTNQAVLSTASGTGLAPNPGPQLRNMNLRLAIRTLTQWLLTPLACAATAAILYLAFSLFLP